MDDLRIRWTRDVILWGVEAYFGHLGGVAVGRARESGAGAPVDEAEENRGTGQ